MMKEVVKIDFNYYKTCWLIFITVIMKNELITRKIKCFNCGCMKLISYQNQSTCALCDSKKIKIYERTRSNRIINQFSS